MQEPAPSGTGPLEGQVIPGRPAEDAPEGSTGEAVQHPAKVMRIATMARHLLEEVRQAELDEASRARLREIYQTSISELSEVLSPDLREELTRLSLPFGQETPSEAELRIAHAQLVGWLDALELSSIDCLPVYQIKQIIKPRPSAWSGGAFLPVRSILPAPPRRAAPTSSGGRSVGSRSAS